MENIIYKNETWLLLLKKINALRLEVDGSIVDNIEQTIQAYAQSIQKPNEAIWVTDEEIEKEFKSGKHFDFNRPSTTESNIYGAKWMRDKIFKKPVTEK